MIILQNIEKKYPHAVYALRDIHLQIQQGEAVAILGKSGSGKTTLMDIIGTLTRPTQGNYLFKGEDIAKARSSHIAQLRRNSFGYIFQSYNLINDWTIHKNLLLAMKYKPVPKQSVLEQALEEIGLAGKLQNPVKTLSGGEQQRVAIVRVILRNPDILLADEPTGNLDKANSEYVMSVLFRLWKSGKTLIMITHNEEIAHLFPRIVLLKHGEIVS